MNKKPRFTTLYGARVQVGSVFYRWLIRNRYRLMGKQAPHKKPVRNLRKAVLAMAGHFVGVKEYPAGSNMQMFGKWYGENGVPWCAIFVSFVLSHNGRPFRYAYVPAIVADARARKGGLRVIPLAAVNAVLSSGYPVLACYDWTHDGTADHVEFVRAVSGSTVHAVGGNTGPTDWSNGGAVAREDREASLVQAFVRVA